MRIWTFALAWFLLTACQAPLSVDLLIINGYLLDGSGHPGYEGVVAINGDTIIYAGPAGEIDFSPDRTIDAAGAVVAPGFIDPHTHTLRDLSDTLRRNNLNYLFQGVTTVVAGSDGGSVIGIGQKLAEWDSLGIGTNAALMAGHRTIRQLIMSTSPEAPTPEELDAMRQLVAKGMEEGALGLSSGLFYSPANFAQTEEVIELAKVAASYGGLYDVHLRDESSYNIGLLAAVEETIRIAEEAGLPANISHIKALGVDVWGQSDTIVYIIEKARDRGLRITADQYPYRASSTGFHSALLPRWVFADDPDYTAKLDDPALLPRIREGIAENLRRRGGPASLLLTTPKLEELKGLTLAEVAESWSMEPVEAALRILRNGSSSVVSFNMQESDIVTFMRQPWVMSSSDGSTGHPRKYGSFPKKIREYVLEKKVMDLPEMIRRSTRLTATTFGIERRGSLEPGAFADIIIFDPEKVRDQATFAEPELSARGMQYVLVNGAVAIDQGEYTGVLAGRALRKMAK